MRKTGRMGEGRPEHGDMEASNDGRLGWLGVLGGLGWLSRSRRLGRLDGQGHWGGEGEHQGTPEGLSAPEMSVSRAMHSGVAGVSAPVSVAAVQIEVDKDNHRGREELFTRRMKWGRTILWESWMVK
jgi:hypothetical protein